jgi:peptidoglycan/LPS O-acetylase OafA/YrhL
MEENRARTAPGVTSRFIAGDPLRAIPAMIVVAYHVVAGAIFQTHRDYSPASFDAVLGPLGTPVRHLGIIVFIFFALSGYLLGLPFARAIVLGRPFPHVRAYLFNRVLRVLPAFWFFLTVTWLVFGREGSSWRELASSYFFGQIYNPGSAANRRFIQAWTLDDEALFYLALPLLALLAWRFARTGTPLRRVLVLLGGLYVVAALSLWYRVTHTSAVGLSTPPSIAFSFVPGLTLAVLEPVLRPALENHRRGPLLAQVVIWTALGLTAFYLISTGSFLARNIAALFACLGILGAPMLLQWSTGRCWRVLDNRPLQWIGARSYSFYLGHLLIVFAGASLIRNHFENPRVGILVTLPPVMIVSLLVAWAGYRWIEEPFIRMRSPWRRGDQPSPLPAHVQAPAPQRVPAG